MVTTMIAISRASAERVTELLEEQSDLHNGSNPVMAVADGSIEFQDVSFSYTGKTNKLCLSDVNLSIRFRETIGVIGGTGSSKSTLVQLIPPSSTTPPAARSWWAAWTSGTTTWKRSETKWPWCCKEHPGSPAPSRTISAGATPTPPTRKCSTPAI